MAIYVDADACPVKAEIYRVARRYGVNVLIVANDAMLIPEDPLIQLVERPKGFDSVDDWIADQATRGDIVVTADIPLAGRCLEKGARVLGPRGRVFTEDSIGEALAGRALQEMLRQSGQIGGGPTPFQPNDRSRFLSKLDELIHAARRDARQTPPPSQR